MHLFFLLFFFFYCYGDHRDLHSFPTRRSSDLPAASRLPLGSARRTVSMSPPKFESLPSPQPVGMDQSAEWGRSTGDRKSTRLNSSHPSISYAVFCLKKKKKKKIISQHNTTYTK